VSGSTTDVSVFVDQMQATIRDGGGRARHLMMDGASMGGALKRGARLAANVAAVRGTHREYVALSARSVELLRKHGEIPTNDGTFWAFVRNAKGQWAGNLDLERVNLGPEQALSLQAAAGQMALQAAVKEITAAIERVEEKVDQLANLAGAKRLGAAIADQATLQPLVNRVRSTGTISSTDWATVASLGPLIRRDVEALRAYIANELNEVTPSSLVRSRAEEAEELSDRMMTESVALLVVAEQNYALWEQLRLAHAVDHERSAVAAVAEDIHHQLAALTAADQRLVDLLHDVADRLAEPTGFEGFAPLQKRRLSTHVDRLDSMREWFCDQRHLDDRPLERPELFSLAESVAKVGDIVVETARGAGRKLAATPQMVARRRGDAGDAANAVAGSDGPTGELPPSAGPGDEAEFEG
jgi:hypothetical protein